MSSLAALEARRGQLIEQISLSVAAKESADRAASRAQGNLNFATNDRSRQQYQSQYERALGESQLQAAKIAKLNSELAEVNAQIAELQRKQGAVQSTGQTTAQAQAARDDAASVTSPPPRQEVIDTDGRINQKPTAAVPTNAERFQPQANTTGTNDPRRPATQTQSTPQSLPNPGPVQPLRPQPVAASSAGAAAAGDDAQGGSNNVRARLNQIFGGINSRVIPQDNLLDQFASYTYNISLYLMSPADYKKLINGKSKNIAGFQLLMQSGGAPLAGGTLRAVDAQELAQAADGNSAAISQPSLGRNQFFPLDFYFDDVKVKSIINGKGTNAAHNVSEVSFKIIEPSGVSLLGRLFDATQQYVAQSGGKGNQSYASQNYLMVIRFYGYDDQGNLVRVGKTGQGAAGSTTDAIVEKFIPFQFKQIKFRIQNRLVEYDCEGVCPQNIIGTGPARGVIPYNVELQSQTLNDLLVGNLKFAGASGTTSGAVPGQRTNPAALEPTFDQAATGVTNPGSTSDLEFGGTGAGEGIAAALGQPVDAGTSPTQNTAPPKANAAPQKEIVSGLVEALNGYQAELVKKGIYEEPDTYKIEIIDSVLKEAKVTPPGQVNLKQTAMTQAKTANETKNPATQKVNNNSKTQKIMAGTSVVQFLDQVVRSSDYIYKQQLKVYDPKTGELKPNGSPAETLAWYRIGIQAEPKPGKYDRKRNDYAYDITYQISIYAVNDVKSDFFPTSKYRGPVKRYKYWFTGENTQILDFTQDYNYLYYIVQNSAAKPRNVTSNAIELERAAFQPNSNQSSQGQDDDKVNEPGANAADYLYSPADQARVKLRILGDPAWIFQGELWSGIAGPNFNYNAFLSDGTINQEGQEILFEVGWNSPVDYNLQTGLQDPNSAVYKSNLAPGIAGQPTQNFVYKTVDVVSTFSRGRFEQELNGVLMTWPLKTKTEVQEQRESDQAQVSNFRDQTSGRIPTLVEPSPETSPSLLDLELGATGPINYTPTPLSKVLDNKKDPSPLAASSLEAEGFDNAALGVSPAEPPTSSGQVVGPASNTAAVRSQGGAAGPAQVGAPSTFVVLAGGGSRPVTSEAEIDALQASGQANAREARTARRVLAAKQQAANSPQSAAPIQRTKRDY